MSGPRLPALVAMMALGACGKTGVGADAGAGADASAGVDAGVGVGVDAGVGAHAAAATTAWKGTYTSAEAVLTLPADVKWRVPETPAGVGDGTLALDVDPATGRVRGTLDGVLGPATVEGLAADGHVTGAVLRKDPRDHGFTGTLAGDLGDGGAHGTLHVTLAEASAVRRATFDLAPAP
jgi:hypothetical protein